MSPDIGGFNWKILRKEVKIMMVIFLATRIVLGKLAFKDLPDALKEPVKKELEANGVGFLAE